MDLSSINWPVFRLGERKPYVLDGVTFYSSEYVNLDTNESRQSMRVVDDQAMAGETLGRRRMKLAAIKGLNLFKIKLAVYFLQDLVKVAKSTTWFIDNAGKVFQYKKSTRAKLTFHKLKKIIPVEGMGCIVEVTGIPQRFKCMFRPSPDQKYAGILRWGLGYILYGFYETEHKPTHRLV